MVAGSKPPGAYLVRLIDCTDAISEADRTAILNQLTTWILAADSSRPQDKRSGANVAWATSVASDTATRLVIYFVADYQHSVVRFKRGFATPPQDWGRIQGLTSGGQTTASEVYKDKCADANCLATFAFHEAMHNQLHMGDEMHWNLDVGLGIALDNIGPQTAPNELNFKAFGAAMENVHPQWIDGYARAHPTQATHPLHPHH